MEGRKGSREGGRKSPLIPLTPITEQNDIEMNSSTYSKTVSHNRVCSYSIPRMLEKTEENYEKYHFCPLLFIKVMINFSTCPQILSGLAFVSLRNHFMLLIAKSIKALNKLPSWGWGFPWGKEKVANYSWSSYRELIVASIGD